MGKHPHGRGEDGVTGAGGAPAGETPPRAWGRHAPPTVSVSAVRNTPTGVGKTHAPPRRCRALEKHPHGRGEDAKSPGAARRATETPPRAWGRPIVFAARSNSGGNTPTGVGKTARRRSCPLRHWKHPHGRGEDAPVVPVPITPMETPPRAWGRRQWAPGLEFFDGNTSTGVGKTTERRAAAHGTRKHPHGRGEDHRLGDVPPLPQETPPRAWGRHVHPIQRGRQPGNTPTGVGKTHAPSLFRHGNEETPPRAWGRQTSRPVLMFGWGNTPTGVGKTAHRCPAPCFQRKHPHGRGEDWQTKSKLPRWRETPPRAWGRQSKISRWEAGDGNTPTGVGKTNQTTFTPSAPGKHPHGRGEDRRRAAVGRHL